MHGAHILHHRKIPYFPPNKSRSYSFFFPLKEVIGLIFRGCLTHLAQDCGSQASHALTHVALPPDFYGHLWLLVALGHVVHCPGAATCGRKPCRASCWCCHLWQDTTWHAARMPPLVARCHVASCCEWSHLHAMPHDLLPHVAALAQHTAWPPAASSCQQPEEMGQWSHRLLLDGLLFLVLPP